MMNTQEALKMAIVAMDTWKDIDVLKARKMCKEALAQPAQKPVGHLYINEDKTLGARIDKSAKDLPQGTHKLYTHPAPSWQGLSDDEITELLVSKGETSMKYVDFARAIEQELKLKNGFNDIKEKNT